VVIYIDRQLAGPYGRDRDRYTQRPFQEDAAPEFGYQGKATAREIYREGLRSLKGFDSLAPAEQDKRLQQIESSCFFHSSDSTPSKACFVIRCTAETSIWWAGSRLDFPVPE
jgi:hypothetical protein